VNAVRQLLQLLLEISSRRRSGVRAVQVSYMIVSHPPKMPPLIEAEMNRVQEFFEVVRQAMGRYSGTRGLDHSVQPDVTWP
jgi:hypothetical protein